MGALVLKLTDGTTTLDLNDMTNYGIPDQEWTPAVATRRVSQLGGRGLYNDVVENIPVHVRGATAAAALANLVALANMLDQAELWYNGGLVDPVVLQYKPINSGLTNPVEALVLGPAGANNMLQLSPQVNYHGNYEIDGLNIRLLRRGLWLSDAEQTSTASHITSGNPEKNSLSWSAAAALPSPVEFNLDFVGSVAHDINDLNMYVAVTNSQYRLQIFEAEAADAQGLGEALFYFGEDPVPWTTTAVSGASGGSVAQTTGGAYEYYSLGFEVANKIPARQIALYAICKNVGGSVSYKTQAACTGNASFDISASAWEKIVPGSFGQTIKTTDTAPNVFYLGNVSYPEDIGFIEARFYPSDTTSNSLQVDYVIAVALDGEADFVFVVNGFPHSAVQTAVLTLDNDPSVDFQATLTCSGGYPSYSGNISVLTKGTSIYLCAFGVSGSGWVLQDGGGNEDLVRLENVYRRIGYIVPK